MYILQFKEESPPPPCEIEKQRIVPTASTLELQQGFNGATWLILTISFLVAVKLGVSSILAEKFLFVSALLKHLGMELDEAQSRNLGWTCLFDKYLERLAETLFGESIDWVDPIPYDTPKPAGHTRFVCISDTHSRTDGIQMPYGDILLHTGDFTELGLPSEVKKFNDWLGNLPYEYKIVIAGNHELTFDKEFMADLVKQDYYRFPSVSKLKPEDFDNVQSLLTNSIYLQDSEVTVKGFRIYGAPCLRDTLAILPWFCWTVSKSISEVRKTSASPPFGPLRYPVFCSLNHYSPSALESRTRTPWFNGWGFNLPRGQSLLDKWNLIPEGIDILMTHGPPLGFRDWVPKELQRVGCVELLNTVQRRVRPKLHVFGGIHEGYGIMTDGYTTYINASTCTVSFQPTNPPIIFDLPNPQGS
ncbi:hypothetical protein MJG53_010608 [Ovis ammon polii x Ovis aries]|uniref:Uncharacterized protein n=1 Tax=Ovis ammon polii x Ovis aries TaxID=2918886 RepID=A0ACB9UUC0_9CETA|nr:hypothetical protein MJG53_010608 [Ovis ammon polii x Ovis aries]